MVIPTNKTVKPITATTARLSRATLCRLRWKSVNSLLMATGMTALISSIHLQQSYPPGDGDNPANWRVYRFSGVVW
jgi:hypothetical protein